MLLNPFVVWSLFVIVALVIILQWLIVRSQRREIEHARKLVSDWLSWSCSFESAYAREGNEHILRGRSRWLLNYIKER